MKRKIAAAAVIIASAVLLILYLIFRSFTSFEVKARAPLTVAAGTVWEAFNDTVTGVSRDGIKCLDLDGNLLWAQSFEMGAPKTVRAGNYVMVYDSGGGEADVFSSSGKMVRIKVKGQITKASVSSSGVSAVLADDGDSHRILVYGSDGAEKANGELHTQNSGYPIALSLSPSGTTLLVSALDLSAGDIKTTLFFYDFSASGAALKNNIAARFSYSGRVIPSLCHFEDGKSAAFSDNEVIIFSNSSVPTVEKEIFLKEKIRSVLTSPKYFALITGDEKSTLTNYTSSGKVRYQKPIDLAPAESWFLSNNEIAVSDGEKLELFTVFGVRKFSYDFSTGIAGIMPWDGGTNYVLIRDAHLEKVHLK